MQLTSLPTLCLLWASLLLLQRGLAFAQAASTYENCVTIRTSPSPHGHISTQYELNTIKIPQDIYITITPGTTVTPAQVTTTSTISTTTTIVSDVPQSTDTFTYKTTTIATATDNLPTSTITHTATQTTTITTTIDATTTIPTPAGFSPVIDTLPSSATKKKRSPMAWSLFATRGILPQPLVPAINLKAPPSWPAAVTCYGVVESFIHTTITKTAKTTTTITAPTPTTTVNTTTVFTTTDVVTTPDASVTVTVTKTHTTTTTNSPSTTTTTTTTLTVAIPSYTATAYAMCASGSNNYAGAIDGAGIVSAEQLVGPDVATAYNGESSAMDCCNSCAANPICAGSGFWGGASDGMQCFIFISSGNTCSPVDFEALYSSAFPPDSGYIFSNGNCGVYNEAAMS